MSDKRNWFDRPVAAVCIMGAFVVLSIFILLKGESKSGPQTDQSYMITLRHYGIDAREMERTAAIPLEDAVSILSGVSSIITFSENSRVRAYVKFHNNADNAARQRSYDAVREAAQRVYETLPASAQRPEIGSSNQSGIPVWIAALWNYQSGNYLDRIVKPAIESIEGIAEVEISGTGVNEIVIIPDQEKIAALGLSLYRIASSLGKNDGIFSGGIIRTENLEIPVTVDNRYTDIDSLRDALIPADGGVVRLGDIAVVIESEREGDSVSRLDGKKTAVISVTAASGINPGVLSKKINIAILNLSSGHFEYKVLQDRGKEEEDAFRSVLIAALGSSVLVALTALLLIRKKGDSLYPGLICTASIPLISVISAAFLSLAGFPVDRKLLAGLSIGIGAAADAVLLTAAGFGKLKDFNNGKNILAQIAVPLVSASVTTLAALFPLASFAEIDELGVIAWALGTVTIVSVVVSMLILPPLIIWGNKPSFNITEYKSLCIINFIQHKTFRFLARMIRFCFRKPLYIPVLCVITVIAALMALFFTGADISVSESENSLYARVEFDNGFRKEEGDNRLGLWAQSFKTNPGIESIQTSARTGGGQILVTFDPRQISNSKVRILLRSSVIPGGFIYIPEPSLIDRNWEIKIFGEDDSKCRELAEKAAGICAALPIVREVVLNFKDGNPRLSLIPRREMYAESGILFSTTADTVRRSVHGPVIYKRINEHGEIDVRLKTSSSQSDEIFQIDELMNFPLLSSGTSGTSIVRLDSVSSNKIDFEPSVFRREDRRRTASFSIRTPVMDPRRVRDQTMEILNTMDFPRGYSIEFDPDAIRNAEALSGTGFRFFLALLFCYMVMASANESFSFPFLVLSAVPPSLAIPVIFISINGTPMNAAMACSLVAVSGMTVNASIITANEFRRMITGQVKIGVGCFYSILRQCFPVLFSMSITTIIGALPFLFLHEAGNNILRSLSFVTITGVSASWICSLVLIPSLIILIKR